MSGSGPVNWSVRSELIQADSTSFADISSAIASFLSAGTWHTASTGSGTLTVDSVNDDWRAILQTAGADGSNWAAQIQPSGAPGSDASGVMDRALTIPASRWIFCNEYQKTNGSTVTASAVILWSYDGSDLFPLAACGFGRLFVPTWGGAPALGVDGLAWAGSVFTGTTGTSTATNAFWSTSTGNVRIRSGRARFGLGAWEDWSCYNPRNSAVDGVTFGGDVYTVPSPVKIDGNSSIQTLISELITQTNETRANLTRLLNTDQDVQWTHVRAAAGVTSVIVLTQAGVSAKIPT